MAERWCKRCEVGWLGRHDDPCWLCEQNDENTHTRPVVIFHRHATYHRTTGGTDVEEAPRARRGWLGLHRC